MSSSRPVITPDSFSGEGSWDDWIDHFESVAAVNEWDDSKKLLWLRVRLTGRAQTAFKQLSTETRASYATCKQGLRERFEPESKKELYLAEFQSRRKRKDEEWPAFAEDLRVLATKAYPDLPAEAKEQLALTHYLGQIENVQVAFSVKQKRPKALDEAVAATLEMESYLHPKPRSAGRVAQVGLDEGVTPVVAGVQASTQEAIMQMMTQMMQRLEKLETERSPKPTQHDAERGPHTHRADQRRRGPARDREGSRQDPATKPRQPVVCLRCGKEGHYARGCAAPRSTNQGN